MGKTGELLVRLGQEVRRSSGIVDWKPLAGTLRRSSLKPPLVACLFHMKGSNGPDANRKYCHLQRKSRNVSGSCGKITASAMSGRTSTSSSCTTTRRWRGLPNAIGKWTTKVWDGAVSIWPTLWMMRNFLTSSRILVYHYFQWSLFH